MEQAISMELFRRLGGVNFLNLVMLELNSINKTSPSPPAPVPPPSNAQTQTQTPAPVHVDNTAHAAPQTLTLPSQRTISSAAPAPEEDANPFLRRRGRKRRGQCLLCFLNLFNFGREADTKQQHTMHDMDGGGYVKFVDLNAPKPATNIFEDALRAQRARFKEKILRELVIEDQEKMEWESMERKGSQLLESSKDLLGDNSVAALKVELTGKMPADTLQYLPLTGFTKKNLLGAIMQEGAEGEGENPNQQSLTSLLIANDQQVHQIEPTIRCMFAPILPGYSDEDKPIGDFSGFKNAGSLLCQGAFKTKSQSRRLTDNADETKAAFQNLLSPLRQEAQDALRKSYSSQSFDGAKENQGKKSKIRDLGIDISSKMFASLVLMGFNDNSEIVQPLTLKDKDSDSFFQLFEKTYWKVFEALMLKELNPTPIDNYQRVLPEQEIGASFQPYGEFVRHVLRQTKEQLGEELFPSAPETANHLKPPFPQDENAQLKELAGPPRHFSKDQDKPTPNRQESIQEDPEVQRWKEIIEHNSPLENVLIDFYEKGCLCTMVLDNPEKKLSDREGVFDHFETKVVQSSNRVVESLEAKIMVHDEEVEQSDFQNEHPAVESEHNIFSKKADWFFAKVPKENGSKRIIDRMNQALQLVVQGDNGILVAGSKGAIQLEDWINHLQEEVNTEITSASRDAVSELLNAVYPIDPQLVGQLSDLFSVLMPDKATAMKEALLIFKPLLGKEQVELFEASYAQMLRVSEAHESDMQFGSKYPSHIADLDVAEAHSQNVQAMFVKPFIEQFIQNLELCKATERENLLPNDLKLQQLTELIDSLNREPTLDTLKRLLLDVSRQMVKNNMDALEMEESEEEQGKVPVRDYPNIRIADESEDGSMGASAQEQQQEEEEKREEEYNSNTERQEEAEKEEASQRMNEPEPGEGQQVD
eukprot:Nk52_evm27s218 gene=Nk52_evmTU27s218